MFLERRASIKMDLSVFNIRVNVKGTWFPLSIWSMILKGFPGLEYI